MRTLTKISLLMLTACVMTIVFVGSISAQEMTKETDWEFMAEIYLWGASVDGTTVSGTDVEVDFGDIADNLNLGFMGLVGARTGKWSMMADVIYLDVEADDQVSPGLKLDVELSGWIVTPAVGYNLADSDKGRLDVLGGARYLDLDLDASLGALGVGDSSSVWDAIVGLKGNYNLTEKWYLTGYVDVGGGGSDLTWQAAGGVGYRFSKVDVVLAYRYLSWEFDDKEVLDDLDLYGPFAGIKFTW